jgi:hypothetical protein
VRTSLYLVLAFFAATLARAQSVLEIDLPANSIAFSQPTGMLYATIPSTAGVPYGNTLIEIDPSSGAITRSVFVGSEPNPVAVSPDASTAYVGLDGAAAVRPVDLAALTAGTVFHLGNSANFGPLYANELAVMPGSPNTVAVSRRADNVSPSYQGVVIYDNGVARPTIVSGFTGSNTIGFGAADTLYGYNNEVSDFTMYRMSINASGISVAASAQDVIYGFYVTIVTDGDTVIASNGTAVAGQSLTILGTYAVGGSGAHLAIDTATSSVLVASSNQVAAFDRNTFVPTYTETLPMAMGSPKHAASCGAACLAVVYDSNQILIVHDVTNEIFADGFE